MVAVQQSEVAAGEAAMPGFYICGLRQTMWRKAVEAYQEDLAEHESRAAALDAVQLQAARTVPSSPAPPRHGSEAERVQQYIDTWVAVRHRSGELWRSGGMGYGLPFEHFRFSGALSDAEAGITADMRDSAFAAGCSEAVRLAINFSRADADHEDSGILPPSGASGYDSLGGTTHRPHGGAGYGESTLPIALEPPTAAGIERLGLSPVVSPRCARAPPARPCCLLSRVRFLARCQRVCVGGSPACETETGGIRVRVPRPHTPSSVALVQSAVPWLGKPRCPYVHISWAIQISHTGGYRYL